MTGKSKVAIDFACIMSQLFKTRRVLVVCPLSVVSVWTSEIRKHAGVPYTCKIYGQDRVDEGFTFGATHNTKRPRLEFVIINYDKVIHEQRYYDLQLWLTQDPHSIIIADEVHKLKNPQARRSKVMWKLGKSCRYRLMLTGTPISKNPLDLFAQFRFYDETVFGTRWAAFRRQYAVFGGYGNYELLRLINLKTMRRKLKPHIFQAKKETCLDLPSKTHEIVSVELKSHTTHHKTSSNKGSRELYNILARDAIAEFKGREIEAPLVLTRMLRLSQITGGFVTSYADDDPDQRQVMSCGTEKLDAFRDLITNLYEQDRKKIVVFCRFLPELGALAKVCKTAGYTVLPFYGATTQPIREQRIAYFEEANEPCVFLAQISTGSLGITLTAASEAIFYSHTYNYAEFEQACDRLHRIGQKRPCTYYHLVAKDTVDETVWLALQTKRDVAKLVMEHPELMTGRHAA